MTSSGLARLSLRFSILISFLLIVAPVIAAEPVPVPIMGMTVAQAAL
jgi:hypothetical protein